MKYFSIRNCAETKTVSEQELKETISYSAYLIADSLKIGEKQKTQVYEITRIANPTEDSETLKFYLWEDVQALADYSSGMAFAIAASKQDAINLIMESHFGTDVHPNLAEDFNRLFNELHMNPPKVMDKPFGYTVRGGA